MPRVVIVGAGHGGANAAVYLRQDGFAGEIVLLGAEPSNPYHRPPLSKSLLKGPLEQPLRPAAFYREQRVDLRLGKRVRALDTAERIVTAEDGSTERYDILILATGARARPLHAPGTTLRHVHSLRTLDDATGLAEALRPATRLVIVGGGWIGLEVAASARAGGVDVTVVERDSRLLARVSSPALSEFIEAYHRAHGVQIFTGADVSELCDDGAGNVTAVRFADGTSLAADRVLIGVGALADDALARDAGLRCDNGVVVDDCARTSDPSVYAVGDVTCRPLAGQVGLFRMESIPSAVEQARQAAAHITGAPAPEPEVPWFWSDQFDLKMQIAGLGVDPEATAVRGDPSSGRFSLLHFKASRLVAVEAVNAAADFMAGKHFIRDAIEVDPDRASDPTTSLRELAAAAPGPMHIMIAASTEPPTLTDAPPLAEESTVKVESAGSNGPTATQAAAGARRPREAGRDHEPGLPRITYVQADGTAHMVDVAEGLSVMEGSLRNNLPGIIAECGGACSCATCHVYIESPWDSLLEQIMPEEDEMLEYAEGRRPNSRLSCQIVVRPELDGLVVHVPEIEG